jgi:hypothetical protein
MVDDPAKVSPIKLSSGLFVMLSILEVSLNDCIDRLYSLITRYIKNGSNSRIQGTTIVAIMMTETDWYTIARKPFNGQKNCYSRTFRSLENLFRILPIGVTSKYKLIGAFKTLCRINRWIFRAPYQADIIKMKLLKKVKNEFKVA